MLSEEGARKKSERSLKLKVLCVVCVCVCVFAGAAPHPVHTHTHTRTHTHTHSLSLSQSRSWQHLILKDDNLEDFFDMHLFAEPPPPIHLPVHPPSPKQTQSKQETGGREGGGGVTGRTQPHFAGQTLTTLEGQGLRKLVTNTCSASNHFSSSPAPLSIPQSARPPFQVGERVGEMPAGKSGSVQRERERERERNRERERMAGTVQVSEETGAGLCKFPASLQMAGERVRDRAGKSGHGQGTLSPPFPHPLEFVTAPLHEDDIMDGIANRRYGGGGGGVRGGGGGRGEGSEGCREGIVERGRRGEDDAEGRSRGWQGEWGRGEDVRAGEGTSMRDATCPVMVTADRKARLQRNKVPHTHAGHTRTHVQTHTQPRALVLSFSKRRVCSERC